MSVTTTNGKAIADYDNYEDGKSSEQVQQFQTSGVIPVAGKYSANGTMETKNVPLSDLLGGGSELPPIESGDTGKVLKVDGNSLVWGLVGDIDGVWAGKGLTGGGSAGTLTLDIDTAHASDGQVLTYNATADDVVWETPSGGSGGGLTPVSVEVVHTSGKCTINVPSNNSFVTVTGLEQYASDTGYGIYIVPPTVASGELLNCVVEIIGGDGNDHWINVEGNYSALASPHDGPLMGYSPAHVTFLGHCFTIVTNGGGS